MIGQKKELRLCAIGLRGIPGVIGGVETYAEQLYPRIKKHMNVDVTVFARKRYVSDQNITSYRSVRVVPLWAPRQQNLEALVHTGYALSVALMKYRPHIVHIQNIGPGFWAPLARVFGTKVVMTYHSQGYKHEKWGAFAKLFLRMAERISLWASNAVIVVSEPLRKDLCLRFPGLSTKLFYVPNGATHIAALDEYEDCYILMRQMEDQYGIKSGQYILYVGRLVPEKGVHDLIHAFCMSSASNQYSLVIAGSIVETDPFTRNLLAVQSDNIKFVDYQPQSRLVALYKNASLTVSASHLEGNPIAVLEAMSLNVPILLSDIESHKELGLPPENYFPVRDSKMLAAKLSSVHRQYRYKGEIPNKFDWKTVAAETARIYASLFAR